MSECNCVNARRIPDIETENGRWPMPDHLESCPQYKRIRYVRVKFDSSWFVMDAGDEADYRKDINLYGDPDEYKYENIYLTKDQFEKLPEFQGF